MLRLVAVAVFVVVASAVDLDTDWSVFKAVYGKKYANKTEEAFRRQVYAKNRQLIASHNKKFSLGKSSFYLGENEFADMTHQEFVSKMAGFKRSQGKTPEKVVYEFTGKVSDLPEAVDWRKKGLVTAVKNQGDCGSCWSFSATGALEGQHAKKSGVLVSLSEQNLLDCCGEKYDTNGCQGGVVDGAFTFVKDNKGIDTEKSYPYEQKKGKCRYNPDNVGATDTGFVQVDQNEEALQAAVANIGPVSVAIDSGSDEEFQLYKGGVYYSEKCTKTNVDHAMLAVGYGVDTTYDEDYWLVKNTYGESWGEKGYIKMFRNGDNMCGIATQACYPTV